jgi:hypothetical protein
MVSQIKFRKPPEGSRHILTVHCTDEQYAMSSHELQIALMLTVEISKVYYTKLYQLCHLNNKYRY